MVLDRKYFTGNPFPAFLSEWLIIMITTPHTNYSTFGKCKLIAHVVERSRVNIYAALSSCLRKRNCIRYVVIGKVDVVLTWVLQNFSMSNVLWSSVPAIVLTYSLYREIFFKRRAIAGSKPSKEYICFHRFNFSPITKSLKNFENKLYFFTITTTIK